MLFGEIVEPTTRALIDDDLEEYPEYTESIPEWEGNTECPETIDNLVFIETTKVRKFFEDSVLEGKVPVSKIKNAGIEIYEVSQNKYLIAFLEMKEFTYGEITELFDKWLKTAKRISAITSESISRYQNDNIREKPASLIRMLSNDDKCEALGYLTLESPNLVTGLGASVLSYCIHIGLPSYLFVVYFDASPLDSLQTAPLLNLVKILKLPVKRIVIKSLPSVNNLYM